MNRLLLKRPGAVGLALLLSLLFLPTQEARADEPSSRATQDVDTAGPAVDISIELGFLLTFAEVCTAEGDLVTCRPGIGFGGVSPTVHWRPSHSLAVGATGVLAFGGNPQGKMQGDLVLEDRDHILWGALADIRAYPFSAVELSIGGQVGLVGYSDTITYYDKGKETRSESATQLAVGAGVVSGIAFNVTDWLLLGLDARALFVAFDEDPVPLSTHVSSNRIGPSIWFGFGLTTTIHLPF